MNLNREALAALDRLDTVATCWAALTDLMGGEHDLPAICRDNLAVLMGFLDSEYQQGRHALTLALRQEAPGGSAQ
jgi:hypothetical protein